MSREIRLDRLLGRPVLATNGRTVGRLEEFRATRAGTDWVLTEFVIGPYGLLERLNLAARRIVGPTRPHGLLARWDQLDLENAEHPRLICPVTELQRL